MASVDLDGASSTVNSEVTSKKEESPIPQEQKKKKKQRATDIVLRDLPQNISDEQKLQILCERLHESQQEQKNLNSKLKQYEQLVKTVKQERDVLQTERNRLILQKDKLETLCRELQKQNKVIQEESLARARAEEEKRREVAEHFQTSITSIQTQLNEYQDRNTGLRKENQDLADKLGEFIKQHEKREEHLQKVMQTRDLEVKLAEAKTNKVQCQLDQERVKAQQQVARMEEEAKLMKERMDMHINLENKLKEQIDFYKNKYKSFNKTMADSNRLFDSAREEMEKLGKRVRQAERDVVEWQGKWELSQRSLLELVKEHKKKTEEAAASKKQSERLAGLCRALQGQLLELRKPQNGTADEARPNVHEQGDGPSEEGADQAVVDPDSMLDPSPADAQIESVLSSPVPPAESAAVRSDDVGNPEESSAPIDPSSVSVDETSVQDKPENTSAEKSG